MQIEGTELPLNPLLLSKACNRGMVVFMASCANSIPVTCFQIFAGQSPAQGVGGCCPLPRSHQSQALGFAVERGFSCRDWCHWPCLHHGYSEVSSRVRFPLGRACQGRSVGHLVWALQHQHRVWSSSESFSLLEEIPQLWNVLGPGFRSRQPACLQSGSLLSKVSCFLAPFVCASWSGAGIVVKAVFYCSFVLRIMVCGFAVEF